MLERLSNIKGGYVREFSRKMKKQVEIWCYNKSKKESRVFYEQ